jgi:hypothetical protein
MLITLDTMGQTIYHGSPLGTVVGTLTTWNTTNNVPVTGVTYTCTSGDFAISGSNLLVVAWETQPSAGTVIPLAVTAANASGTLRTQTINIEIEAPDITAITLTPPTFTFSNTAPAGAVLATVEVEMANGADFAGTLTCSPSSVIKMSGNQIILARALTSADNGNVTGIWTVSATRQNPAFTLTVPLVGAVGNFPVPTGVTFNPDTLTLPDNLPAGTVIATLSA